VPASTALTEVRRRVGEEPLKVLLGRVAGALSPGRAEWSHVGGLLAVAWDGTTVAVPGTDENAAAFGKPAAGKKSPGKGGKPAVSAGFPLVRLVALVACGTRAVLGAGCGPVRGKGGGEQDLARGLLGSLGPGMLLLADRNFCSYALWNAAAGTGADLLWRAKASMHLPVIRVLPDGSESVRNSVRGVVEHSVSAGHRGGRDLGEVKMTMLEAPAGEVEDPEAWFSGELGEGDGGGALVLPEDVVAELA